MGLFKSKYEKEMDSIISKLEMNMSNNYKDAAQNNLRELEEAFESFVDQGKLKEKARNEYGKKIDNYKTKMQGYTHKDQKPYWT